tara:strand:- start:1081 stop:1227 length:147 start_codon:yes stop_codon:yes gene_type:complete
MMKKVILSQLIYGVKNLHGMVVIVKRFQENVLLDKYLIAMVIVLLKIG